MLLGKIGESLEKGLNLFLKTQASNCVLHRLRKSYKNPPNL
jgi:hypothetical protein